MRGNKHVGSGKGEQWCSYVGPCMAMHASGKGVGKGSVPGNVWEPKQEGCWGENGLDRYG